MDEQGSEVPAVNPKADIGGVFKDFEGFYFSTFFKRASWILPTKVSIVKGFLSVV